MIPLLQVFEDTVKALDRQVSGLQAEYKDQLACKKGCSGCCLDGFKVRYIEGLFLMKGFSEAPTEVAQAILQNLHDPKPEQLGKCPALIDNACSLYEHRPLLCRAYGIILKLKEKIATCSLNFQEVPEGTQLKMLDMEPYYELLNELSETLWRSDLFKPVTEKDPEPPMLTIREWLETFTKIQMERVGIGETPVPVKDLSS